MQSFAIWNKQWKQKARPKNHSYPQRGHCRIVSGTYSERVSREGGTRPTPTSKASAFEVLSFLTMFSSSGMLPKYEKNRCKTIPPSCFAGELSLESCRLCILVAGDILKPRTLTVESRSTLRVQPTRSTFGKVLVSYEYYLFGA